jgi:2'-5' RNA ligase
MDRQLSFFPDSPSSADNRLLFLALVPEAFAAQEIHEFAGGYRRAHGLFGTLRPLNHLHLSLQAVVGWSEGAVQAAERACAAAVRHAHPFEIGLDCAMYWPSSHAYVLTESTKDRNSSLRKFQGHLNMELLRELGPKKIIKSSFTPHVTMFYGNESIPNQRIDPICWTVTVVHLICSHQKETKYDWLGHWSLLD